MATFKIRCASLASANELAPDLPTDVPLKDTSAQLQLARAEHLSPRSQDVVYDLFNRNMAEVSANSSLAYNEATKRAELFDSEARYLLLLRPPLIRPSPSGDHLPMPGGLPRKGKAKAAEVDFRPEDLLGYCSFRFDTEETLGSRDVEVIYCYEVQLDPSLRGQGLAKMLMDRLERIGRERNMEKSMLTCLKINTVARRFYEKQGYQPDEIDPTRMAEEESEDEDDGWEEVGSDGEPLQKEPEEEVDYVILSKNLAIEE